MGRPPTNEEIDKAFFPAMPDEASVFSSLPVNQKQQVANRAKENKKTKYRTFVDIMNDCRPALDHFCTVMEQIPIWFSASAEKGYLGGTSIVNRPRVETTLKQYFGEAGNAAIHVYVLQHYETMLQKQNGRTKCGEVDYRDNFEYDVWNDLGRVLINKWKGPIRFDEFKDALSKYKNRVVVLTFKIFHLVQGHP